MGWSIAASLMCMIYALGNCSGGHFNPAVTLAVFLSGRNKIDATEAVYYACAPIVGGILGGLITSVFWECRSPSTPDSPGPEPPSLRSCTPRCCAWSSSPSRLCPSPVRTFLDLLL